MAIYCTEGWLDMLRKLALVLDGTDNHMVLTDSAKDMVPMVRDGYHVELWVYSEGPNGHNLVYQEMEPCLTCFDYTQTPGRIFNAGQWVNCPECAKRGPLS